MMSLEDKLTYILLNDAKGWKPGYRDDVYGLLQEQQKPRVDVPRGSIVLLDNPRNDIDHGRAVYVIVSVVDQPGVKFTASINQMLEVSEEIVNLLRPAKYETRYQLITDRGRAPSLHCWVDEMVHYKPEMVHYKLPDEILILAKVRYIGPVHNLGPGTRIGLQIMDDDWVYGDTNGTLDGRVYFAADDSKGVFCHVGQIVRIQKKEELSQSANGIKRQSFESPNGMPHNIDWTTRIQEAVNASHDTHVPPDITFKIEDNGSTYKIEAHKVIMGWVSKVFDRMLFVTDTADKGTKELLVKGTTKQAFQIMKDAIYNTEPINDLLIGKSVHEVFAVLDLVIRYEITYLELLVKDYINNFPLTEENVLEVAEDAMLYAGTFKGTFKDEAQLLLIGCSKFLKPRFTDVESVFEYIADNEDHNEVLLKLMALMKEVPPAPTPTVCLNCQQDVCLNGREIQNDQFRVGPFHDGVIQSWTEWD